MVWAVNQDSPQCGHEIAGIPSITSKPLPLPKLRVTGRICRPGREQCTQGSSECIDGDENEFAAVPGFGDGFGGGVVKRDTADDALDLARLPVALAFGDGSREDNVFEVKNREVVIVKFVGCVCGDNVIE